MSTNGCGTTTTTEISGSVRATSWRNNNNSNWWRQTGEQSSVLLGQQWPKKKTIGDKCNHKLEGGETKKMASVLSEAPTPTPTTTPSQTLKTQMSPITVDWNHHFCASQIMLVNNCVSGDENQEARAETATPPLLPPTTGQEDQKCITNNGNQLSGKNNKQVVDDRESKECDSRRTMALHSSIACRCKSKQEENKRQHQRDEDFDDEEAPSCYNECDDCNNRVILQEFARKKSANSSCNLHTIIEEGSMRIGGSIFSRSKSGNRFWPCYSSATTPELRHEECELTKKRPQLDQKRKPTKHRKEVSRHLGDDNQDHNETEKLSGSLKQQQCISNQMILFKLAQLVFTYIIITSSIIVPVTTTNYWPQRNTRQQITTSPIERPVLLRDQSQLHPHLPLPLQATPAAIVAIAQSQPQPSPIIRPHQLMIGQHYNNFSSIVPYSIVQDSDYGPMSPEDQLMEDEQQQHHHHQQHEEHFEGGDNNRGSNSNNDVNTIIIATAPRASDRDEVSKSRALLPLDSNRLILPQMQQIKSRFNQGCVGGTKCQFFAFCWMSGGSLGASCGLLMTCCVTPSRQEIQPGFYGPVVNDPYCGRSTSKINRIVGGTDASFGQFPWQAFVQVGGSRCGGALISSRHVVTAGHCVARSQHSPSSIKVTLGDYILNSDIESIPHEVFTVVEVLLHPNFRFTPQADRYDVAVLELDRTASYKDNIKPICLPQKDATFVGRVAYVAGWGALQAGSKLRPKVLQHVAVPVIENPVCESWHRRKGIDIRIYDEMMCAGYELGQRDACQGDSGGPLMLNQFGVWYLVGIVSAGYSCAKQYQPGIYHRVSSSSDWISSNVYQQGASK